jgi:hypothetical protein
MGVMMMAKIEIEGSVGEIKKFVDGLVRERSLATELSRPIRMINCKSPNDYWVVKTTGELVEAQAGGYRVVGEEPCVEQEERD